MILHNDIAVLAAPTGSTITKVAALFKKRVGLFPATTSNATLLDAIQLLKKYGFVPDKLVTDDLRSYGAAASDLGMTKRHERGRWCNNRVENSHQPTRRRERKMQGFKSVGSAQKFLSMHAAAHNTFNVQRHLTSARTHRAFRASALQTWLKSSLWREPNVPAGLLRAVFGNVCDNTSADSRDTMNVSSEVSTSVRSRPDSNMKGLYFDDHLASKRWRRSKHRSF